jgi:cyclopropane-fatty-acyl-phospholipid synthase
MSLKENRAGQSRFQSELPLNEMSQPVPVGRLVTSVRRKLLGKFTKVHGGRVEVFDGNDTHVLGSQKAEQDLLAKILVNDPLFYKKILLGGTIGSAESYIAGQWECSDLTSLIRIMIRNMDSVSGLDKTVSKFRTWAYRISHSKRRNTKSGSRKNIQDHYDLGNDFYETFLDPTMNYSSGIFDEHDRNTTFSFAEDELHAASLSKMDRICRKLQLNASHHVLEIGTGWGAMAVHMAQHFGCRVTSTTISDQQYLLAVERVKAAGLEDRVTILRSDYRDLTGQYDKLVSVEMVEAVGRKFMNTFFEKCSSLLRDNGDMLLQAITMSEQNYADYIKSVDFIRAFVFPGGCLPTVTSLGKSASVATDLRSLQMEDMTPHYALTLAAWKARFIANVDRVRSLGYEEEFLRLWHFYLCYCEAAFEERRVHCIQTIFSKPKSTLDLSTTSLPRSGVRNSQAETNAGCLI